MRRERDSRKLIGFMLLARATFLRKDAETMSKLAKQLLGDADE